MRTDKISIILFDDNSELRKSLGKYLGTVKEFNFVGAFPDVMNVIDICLKLNPNVILMDIDMPGISGIKAVKLIKDKLPHIKVLMLTVFDEDDKIFNSICNGACGYLLKKAHPLEMVNAIKDVYKGGAPLSPSVAIKIIQLLRSQNTFCGEEISLNARELEILSLLSKGLSYKMIGTECNICIDTVRFYIKRIYQKLHVHSMTEAVNKAIRIRLV